MKDDGSRRAELVDGIDAQVVPADAAKQSRCSLSVCPSYKWAASSTMSRSRIR
jgi:hypothetical protein